MITRVWDTIALSVFLLNFFPDQEKRLIVLLLTIIAHSMMYNTINHHNTKTIRQGNTVTKSLIKTVEQHKQQQSEIKGQFTSNPTTAPEIY